MIRLTFTDFASGRDPVMEATMRVLEATPQ